MITIERTLGLLRVLSESSDGTGIKELSAAIGAPASTVHRLLRVLVDQGFVVQEAESRRYSIGPQTLALSRSYLRRRSLVATARPHLTWLRDESGETAFVTTLVGDAATCVAIADCDRPLRLFIEVGQRMPYHAAASARVILAYQSLDQAARLLADEPFEPFTHATPKSPEDVMALLPEIRRNGYAVCEDELDEHVTALAAPVHDASGRVSASVTVVAPGERLQGARRGPIVDLVLEAGARISAALGHVDGEGAKTARPMTIREQP